MDAGFWHERWDSGRIGFHQDRPLPLLCKHWPALDLPPGSLVFVPLCGKSLDMAWLAAQGHRVLGVELSERAIRQFFAERGLTPAVHDSAAGTHFVSGPFELICGDAFALDAALLADCAGIYDRAALVALPPDLRATYAATTWHRMPAGCRGLLVTLEYPQHEKSGPPFSLAAGDVHALLDGDWQVDPLETRDILDSEPGFVASGVTALSTHVYRVARRS